MSFRKGVYRINFNKKMNRKNKEFGEVVSVRLSEQEKENLDKLCRVLSVIKSEFLRNRILGINQVT